MVVGKPREMLQLMVITGHVSRIPSQEVSLFFERERWNHLIKLDIISGQLDITGQIEGRQSRERNPMRLTGQIHNTLDIKVYDAIYTAHSRNRWDREKWLLTFL